MRKTCSSSKCWCTSLFSSRALARSVPNGFSTITRRQAAGEADADRPAAPSCSMTVAYATAGSPGRRARRRRCRSPASRSASRSIERRIGEVAADVVHPFRQRSRDVVFFLDAGELLQAVAELRAEPVVAAMASRATPITENRAGRRWPRDRACRAPAAACAGSGRPDAPKMTSVVGPGVGSIRRPSCRGFAGTYGNDTRLSAWSHAAADLEAQSL